MVKPSKIILVSAEFHPLHKDWLRLAQRLASSLGIDLEVKLEDYVFVNQYGEKDDFGMAWLPQLFLVLEENNVFLLLSQYPFDKTTLKPDESLAIQEVKKKLKELGIEVVSL
ncbi:MAG: hypothetical protein QXN05_01295 [Acidilobaceae archaeon]